MLLNCILFYRRTHLFVIKIFTLHMCFKCFIFRPIFVGLGRGGGGGGGGGWWWCGDGGGGGGGLEIESYA
jgi:hypothetical protein